MAETTHLIMSLLRIITPEEIGEITTKHNGGRFQPLTDLMNERVHQHIYRDFSSYQPEGLDSKEKTAKILPFPSSPTKKEEENSVMAQDKDVLSPEFDEEKIKSSLNELAQKMAQLEKEERELNKHADDENMSSFILIEKIRLKKSQQALKEKEILALYQKNISVDVEQIRGQEDNMAQSKEAGVLVNRKQY